MHHLCTANKATENFTAVIWLARKVNSRGDKIGEIKTGTKCFNPTFRSKKKKAQHIYGKIPNSKNINV